MAIALAARHSMRKSSASPTNGDGPSLDGCSNSTDLWQELLARTSAAAKVLVQFNRQLVTASSRTQSEQLGADLDLLWNSIPKGSAGYDSSSDSGLSVNSDGEGAPVGVERQSQPLLKDAAAAITSLVRTVSMHSEAATLHRCASA